MELKRYFQIIGKYWIVFFVSIVVITLGSFFVTKSQPKSYLASTTITVNKASAVKQSQVNYYLYDNYYNVQSAQLFSQTVTSWFTSPAMVSDIYAKAGVPLPSLSQAELPTLFKALRREPSSINLSTVSSSSDEAQKLIDAAVIVTQEKTNELAKTDKENVYDIVKFNTLVSDNVPNVKLNTLIGLIVGIMFGAIFALSIEYFKTK